MSGESFFGPATGLRLSWGDLMLRRGIEGHIITNQ
jgi:hypothetical protein